MLFGLVIFSIPWIRHRFYETFWSLHILLALSYLGLLYWHTGKEEDSWAYLWATLALLLAQFLVRTFHFNRVFNLQNQWLEGSPARTTVLPGESILLEVRCPELFTWRPGQHCYIRLPSVHFWFNHPFTIANASNPKSSGASRIAKFLVRKRGDFTDSLLLLANSRPPAELTAMLDGPYGGYRYNLERAFDQLILISGGGGITACIPWLQHAAKLATEGIESAMLLRHIVVVWMVRREEHLAWADSEILQALAGSGALSIRIQIHVTAETKADQRGREQTSTSSIEKGTNATHIVEAADLLVRDEVEIYYDKPFVKSLLPSLIEGSKTFVLGMIFPFPW